MTQTVPRTALIMAGGLGLRVGQPLPKQFLLLNGKPVLMHTLSTFAALHSPVRLILVLPADHIDYWTSLCQTHGFTLPHECVPGGACRFESVKNGLARVGEEGLVAIHDGVRPLVSQALIERCFLTAAEQGTCIPVTSLIESLRRIDRGGSLAVCRDDYRLVQTPQTFKAALIKEAYRLAEHTTFTDDAAVVEAMGQPVFLVEGERHNLKITEPIDLELAAFFAGRLANR